jgi:hypothetical protein
MPKILSTGRQYIITISPEIMKTMGWEKGTELILSKVPGEKQVYLEEVDGPNKSSKDKSKKKEKQAKEQPKLHYPHGGVL